MRACGRAGAIFHDVAINRFERFRYAGGGLSRHQYLVHTPTDVYLVPDMAWVHANVTDVSKLAANGATPGAGDRAEAGSVHVVAEGLISNAGAGAAKGVVVTATFYDQTGSVVATERTNPLTVGALGNHTFKIAFVPKVATELWSVPRAYIYTASIAVAVSNIVAPIPHPGVPVHDAAAITLAAAADGGRPRAAASSVVDVVNVTYGVKHVRLDPDMGMYLNARRTKMRGYCDHSTFGGVGSAVPDRVQLYKVSVRVVFLCRGFFPAFLQFVSIYKCKMCVGVCGCVWMCVGVFGGLFRTLAWFPFLIHVGTRVLFYLFSSSHTA